ncbi:MAG: DUF4124 domain-containing protein [Granulosicoccaceae bacterium]
MRKVLLTAATILLATVQTTLPTQADAAIYKCQDDSGGITYTSSPCPVSETTSKVLKSSGKSTNSADCRIANNFALDVATKMRNGRSVDAAFMEYGGINGLQPTTISIINYVYSHKHNISTVPARVAQLSAARCDSSAYGNPSCDQFPIGFISEAGGCDAASGGEGSVSATAEQMQLDARNSDYDSSTPAAAANNLTALRAAPAVRSSLTGMTQHECRKSFEAKMSDVRESMRARLSADQQNQLRAEYKELRIRKGDC